MKHSRAVLTVTLSLLAANFAQPSPVKAQGLNPRTEPKGQVYGDLIIGEGKTREKLAPRVWKYWLFDGGKTLLWAGSDGAGGYENEGQSLWRYDSATKKQTKLAALINTIHSVQEVYSTSGKRGFVLTTFDGGLGAPHIVVVRDRGGVAWQVETARIAAIRNGRIAVAKMRREDIPGTEDTSKVPVQRMIYRSIDSLLR